MTSTFCLVRVRDCRFRLVAIYQFMYSTVYMLTKFYSWNW